MLSNIKEYADIADKISELAADVRSRAAETEVDELATEYFHLHRALDAAHLKMVEAAVRQQKIVFPMVDIDPALAVLEK